MFFKTRPCGVFFFVDKSNQSLQYIKSNDYDLKEVHQYETNSNYRTLGLSW